MINKIQTIVLEKLLGHPANPNRMSKVNFRKLVRNIERSGRYEPIVVRPHPQKENCFEIINGHHRCRALAKLGYTKADCVVWDIDDEQTEILLATLNRLCGSDEVDKKIALLRRLNKKMQTTELAKLLPLRKKQLQRLTNLKLPPIPAKTNSLCFANPMVFFLSDEQKRVVEEALKVSGKDGKEGTAAGKRGAGLAEIAQFYIEHSRRAEDGG